MLALHASNIHISFHSVKYSQMITVPTSIYQTLVVALDLSRLDC